MAERKPVVLVGGQLQELPAGDTIPVGAVLPALAGQALKQLQVTSDESGVQWAVPVSGAANIARTAKTSAYTLQDADKGAMIDCSGTWTLGADAGIAAGWWAYVRNTGSGDITIDPAGATTIGGAATYALPPRVALLLVRSASGFETVAIQSDTIGAVVSATTTPPDGAWLPCDSSVYLQSSYAALFAKLGLLPDAPVLAGVFTQRTLPVSANWCSVTYGGGVFVAVAQSSTIAATSPDGITWTQRTLPASANWLSVTYGNGVFVAVAYGGTIAATSPNGITWTQRTLPASANWLSVTYGNGVFVTVAYNSTIAATSTDGITWTQRTLPVSANWRSVTYGGGVFVAVTNGGTIAATSPDGITWTQRTLPASASWYSVTYGGGVFVAVAQSSTIAATSPDGITWTQRTLPVSADWLSVTYGGGMFVAVAQSGTIAATSPDGITWTQRTLPASASWYSVTYGGGMFVAVAYDGTIAATSGKFLTYNPATQFAVPPPVGQIGVKQYIKAA